ncbi:ATP synthase F1 subunit alpha [Capsicum annuum]|nr:ATP synthase F1 subunit alpha [Capsicum annuum]
MGLTLYLGIERGNIACHKSEARVGTLLREGCLASQVLEIRLFGEAKSISVHQTLHLMRRTYGVKGSVYAVTLPAFQRFLENGPDAAERRSERGFTTGRGTGDGHIKVHHDLQAIPARPGKATRLGVRGSIVPAASRTSYSSFWKVRGRTKGKLMRSSQDALKFHSVGKEDLLNKSPINLQRLYSWCENGGEFYWAEGRWESSSTKSLSRRTHIPMNDFRLYHTNFGGWSTDLGSHLLLSHSITESSFLRKDYSSFHPYDLCPFTGDGKCIGAIMKSPSEIPPYIYLSNWITACRYKGGVRLRSRSLSVRHSKVVEECLRLLSQAVRPRLKNKENEPKFQVLLGNLPDKVDCKMILTLPREFMAKTNQNESLEGGVVDTQQAFHEVVMPKVPRGGYLKKVPLIITAPRGVDPASNQVFDQGTGEFPLPLAGKLGRERGRNGLPKKLAPQMVNGGSFSSPDGWNFQPRVSIVTFERKKEE